MAKHMGAVGIKPPLLNAAGYRYITDYAADKICAKKAHRKEMPWDVLQAVSNMDCKTNH